MMRDWDDEFANSAHVPGSEDPPARQAAQAGTYRPCGPDRADTP